VAENLSEERTHESNSARAGYPHFEIANKPLKLIERSNSPARKAYVVPPKLVQKLRDSKQNFNNEPD